MGQIKDSLCQAHGMRVAELSQLSFNQLQSYHLTFPFDRDQYFSSWLRTAFVGQTSIISPVLDYQPSLQFYPKSIPSSSEVLTYVATAAVRYLLS